MERCVYCYIPNPFGRAVFVGEYPYTNIFYACDRDVLSCISILVFYGYNIFYDYVLAMVL